MEKELAESDFFCALFDKEEKLRKKFPILNNRDLYDFFGFLNRTNPEFIRELYSIAEEWERISLDKTTLFDFAKHYSASLREEASFWERISRQSSF